MGIPGTRENLTKALALADESSRAERVERIEWLSDHYFHPGVVQGDMTVLHLLEEARLCFVSGHFVAAVLLATSFVEQTLSEELAELTSAEGRKTFEVQIQSGRKHLDFPSDLFDRTDRLRELRNPFTHRKAPGHPHSLGSRFLKAKVHPASILEEDAKLAMGVMYEWFRRTLRGA